MGMAIQCFSPDCMALVTGVGSYEYMLSFVTTSIFCGPCCRFATLVERRTLLSRLTALNCCFEHIFKCVLRCCRCPGWFGPQDNPSRRMVWPVIYVREPGDDNLYARPVEGIDMRVDLQLEKVTCPFLVCLARVICADVVLQLRAAPSIYYYWKKIRQGIMLNCFPGLFERSCIKNVICFITMSLKGPSCWI